MSKLTKQQKKGDNEAPSECANTCLASIKDLLEKHRANMAADFKNSFAALESRLEKMQSTVSDHRARIVSLETNAESNDQRIRTLESRMEALADSNNKLLAKTSDLESRSRRNNIRIIGLPEAIEGPTPTLFFSKLLVDLLGEEILRSPPELDRAHRALTAKPQPGSRPRPVIIRVHRYQIKDLIVREARRRRGKLQYQGVPVQIFEDYAPDVVEERAKYRTVMAELYSLALRPALLFPARLQVTLRNGTKKRLSSPEEAAAFASSYKLSPGTD